MIGDVGRGDTDREPGRRPATVCVLSGDVHHAYVARPEYRDASDSRVYQLTCSPMHNYVPVAMKLAFRLSWSVPAERAVRFVLGRFATMPPMKISWGKVSGPYFGNQIATLQLTGRAGRLAIESATGAERSHFTTVAEIVLGGADGTRTT